MVTWADNPPERPAPGTVPRSAWSRFFEAAGLVHSDRAPEVLHQGPDGPAGCVREPEPPS
jgi:hypothetical protein